MTNDLIDRTELKKRLGNGPFDHIRTFRQDYVLNTINSLPSVAAPESTTKPVDAQNAGDLRDKIEGLQIDLNELVRVCRTKIEASIKDFVAMNYPEKAIKITAPGKTPEPIDIPNVYSKPTLREMIGKVTKTTPLGGMNMMHSVDYVALETALHSIADKLDELEGNHG